MKHPYPGVPIHVPQEIPEGVELGVVERASPRPFVAAGPESPELAGYERRTHDALTEGLRHFPTVTQEYLDTSVYGVGVPWFRAFQLNGRKVRSFYCRNGSLSMVSVYVGALPNGKLLDLIPPATWHVNCVGDDIAAVTFAGTGQGLVGHCAMAVTDDLWAPEIGTIDNPAYFSTQANTVSSVTPSVTDTIVSLAPGRLFSVQTTVAGASNLVIRDGVGGPIIFNGPGTVYPIPAIFPNGIPFYSSLIVSGAAAHAAVTLSYSK